MVRRYGGNTIGIITVDGCGVRLCIGMRMALEVLQFTSLLCSALRRFREEAWPDW